MNTCFVTNTDWVNLRSVPNSKSRNSILTVLPRGHECTSRDESNTWWHIKTEEDDVPIEGYIHSNFLTHVQADLEIETSIRAVHMTENLADVTPNSKKQAYPIGDPERKVRDMTNKETKIESIHQIISYLDVENSRRYVRDNYTYCNIYAYDFCYLSGVYLPRVWWSTNALISFIEEKPVNVKYGQSIFEIRANEIYKWMKTFGTLFGWRRVFSAQELQDAADQGKVGIIVANTKNHAKSGHICVVVPQTDEHKPVVERGKVITPVMSDAGWTNHNYYSRRWWTNSKYSFFGFWVHE